MGCEGKAYGRGQGCFLENISKQLELVWKC